MLKTVILLLLASTLISCLGANYTLDMLAMVFPKVISNLVERNLATKLKIKGLGSHKTVLSFTQGKETFSKINLNCPAC